MNKIRFLLLIAFGLIWVALSVEACSCGCEVLGNYGIGGPIITMPAYTLPKGKLALNTSLRYQNVYEFGASDFAFLNRNDIHAHSRDYDVLLSASAAYGITDDLNVMISYPYRIISNLQSTGHGSTVDGGDAIGLGDMTLTMKYRFLNGHKFCGVNCKERACMNTGLQAALVAGIKMPTGQTNERDVDGFKLGADEQPGTGSWDPIMGMAFSLPMNNFSFDTSTLYKLSTQGVQSTTVGDQVSFNTAVTYNFPAARILGQSMKPAAVLELNGIWQEKVEYLGVKDNSHGGLVMFISPGMRLALNDSTVANFSIGMPVITDLNGFQPDLGVQLFAGLSRVF